MARISVDDLPMLEELSAEEKKGIFGGATTAGQQTGGTQLSSLDGFGDDLGGIEPSRSDGGGLGSLGAEGFATGRDVSTGASPRGLPDPGDLRILAEEVWEYVEERLGDVLEEGSSD